LKEKEKDPERFVRIKTQSVLTKDFRKKLAKNEVLSTIIEGAIREAKQSKQLKRFAENNRLKLLIKSDQEL